MSTAHYDVAVIGGGPGGYTAALYCARSGRSVVVLEKLSAGGQMATTDQVDNYPGFDEGINGFELAERMERQAQRFGAVEPQGGFARLDAKTEIALYFTVCLQGSPPPPRGTFPRPPRRRTPWRAGGIF